MRLYDILSSDKTAVWRALQNFKDAISRNEIWRPKEDVQFVFLCGANIQQGVPSKRRQILLDFSSRHLPYTKFFLAESIFTVLKAEGHKINLLDIENDLLNFSDFVIIILESESAFCELGAFAVHEELRKKLIVINDYAFQNCDSFINLGPVEAISEITDGKHVLHYKMDKVGKLHGDAIGDVFSRLHKIIHKKPTRRRNRIDKFEPNRFFTKDSLRFVHDLVLFSSPISSGELSRIIKILFSKSKETQLQKHLALLCATEQIKITSDKLYVSLQDKPFFEYGIYDIYNLMASFKNLYFRYDSSRLKCS